MLFVGRGQIDRTKAYSIWVHNGESRVLGKKMKLRYITILGAASIVASSNASLTGNLYLTQGNGGNGSNFIDQVFEPANAAFSTVSGNVVTVGASGWNISNIQAEFVDNGAVVTGGLNSMLLTVSTFSGTPNTNHTTGVSAGGGIVFSGLVTSTITNSVPAIFNMETNTSGIGALQGLAAGQYLFTYSLNGSLATFGQGFHTLSTDTSTNGWSRNAGGGFGLPGGTNWATYVTQTSDTTATQFSLGINGANAVPEPASIAILGLGALGLLVRRRKNS